MADCQYRQTCIIAGRL